jgi:hypothetical protein
MSDQKVKPSRRGFFLGAAAVGAATAAVSSLPGLTQAPEPVAELKPPPERGGGYSLSEHVKRYYKTTRV